MRGGAGATLAFAIALGGLGPPAGAARQLASPREDRGVFAAASRADVLTEIGKAWEAESGHNPVFN
ncbi:MAG: hypothetical protein ACHP85_23665, partial [Burkholderiales bacterium]